MSRNEDPRSDKTPIFLSLVGKSAKGGSLKRLPLAPLVGRFGTGILPLLARHAPSSGGNYSRITFLQLDP